MQKKATRNSPKPTKPAPNEWVVGHRSAIHRHGIFAARAIPKGTRIIEYVGEKITKRVSFQRAVEWLDKSHGTDEGSVYIFELNSRYDIDGRVSWNLARHINHSCDPNAEARVIRGHIWIVATRNIPEGKEITYDYGYDLEHWEEHPCNCGSPKCVGYIVRKDQRRKLKQLIAQKQAANRESGG